MKGPCYYYFRFLNVSLLIVSEVWRTAPLNFRLDLLRVNTIVDRSWMFEDCIDQLT